MSHEITLPVRITSDRGPESQGEIRVTVWSPKERRRRALKFLFYSWVAAFFCVLIPLLHFVLVPGAILGGLVLAFVVYSQERSVAGGKGTCPECKEPLTLPGAVPDRPFRDLCPKCQTSVRVTQIENSESAAG